MSGEETTVLNLNHLWSTFIALHLTGQVGLILLLITYFISKNINRHPTIVNFWITWLVYSVAYSLQLYHRTKYPSFNTLCRVQAALVDGSPPMVATAGLVAVVQIWINTQTPHYEQKSFSPKSVTSNTIRTRFILCLAVPYAVFLAFSIASAIVGKELDKVELLAAKNGLYCSLSVDGFARYGIPAYCTVIMIALIGFEVAIVAQYCATRCKASRAFKLLKREISLSLILRVSVLSLVSIMVFSSAIFFMTNFLVPWPFMIQAALPLAAVLIFGTQRELLLVWCFWIWKLTPKCPKKGGGLDNIDCPEMGIPAGASSSSTAETAPPLEMV